MPILKKEQDIYPLDLWENETLLNDKSRKWWCVYTISRREKELTRRLVASSIACYAPLIPKRYRSPNGRLRTSFIPAFANYVFMLGNDDERYTALTSNCISKCDLVTDPSELVNDLKQISHLIAAEVPLTPESKLVSGNKVRVRSGPFAGYEGKVLRREGKTRLLLSVHYLEQGVSMQLDEAVLEPID